MDQIPTEAEAIRQTVRDAYGKAAQNATDTRATTEGLGYAVDQLDRVPEEANLGLGCGNPTAVASLRPGDVVVDLGSGGGLDALIAAERVGPTGRVIGVDMTPEMLARARKAAVDAGVADRVEFREGVIESLPVVSASVDVVLSNCVVNLSPDKPQVFREAHRILKPGGRLSISDILLTEKLPEPVAQLAAAYTGCLGGAMLAEHYLAALAEAGFTDIRHTRRSAAGMIEAAENDPTVAAFIEGYGRERVQAIAQTVFSYQINAIKP